VEEKTKGARTRKRKKIPNLPPTEGGGTGGRSEEEETASVQ